MKLILDGDEGKRTEPSKVGQAAYDILSKEQPKTEVGEVISGYADSYVKEMEEAVKRGLEQHTAPFYVVVLHKKEIWSVNVVRNWFVTRQTKPTMVDMWGRFPNHMHTVYEFDGSGVNLLWSLPSPQEGKVILQNWALYDPQLVKWVQEAFSSAQNHSDEALL